MQDEIEKKRDALAALCHRYGVVRLEVFGSAARGIGLDPKRSDVDFLVTFTPRNDLATFADLKHALEELLGRPVDLDATAPYIGSSGRSLSRLAPKMA